MKNGFLAWAKKYHKWPALFISLFLIMFSVSGILLNHRELISGVNVSRKVLPPQYRLENWNLASVRSSVKLSDGSYLLYGGSGIWKTDSLYSSFTDFNSGFSSGMDLRKVRIVKESPGGSLLAGTFFGLYKYSEPGKSWEKIKLPLENERVQDILFRDNRVFILTRSEIVSFTDEPGFDNPEIINLKAPVGYDNKISMFRFLWIMHSGEIAGIAGRLLMDFLALLIIFLVSTGLVVFFVPKISKRLRSGPGDLSIFRRKNLHLHNITGAWFIVFLVVVPLTGMFLRPPFLITVANSKIPMIPLEVAGRDNPWEDKLRAIVWNHEAQRYIISTSDGLFHCNSEFSDEPVPFEVQPPVSVMGINVFEPCGKGCYLVGSFDGLFRWNPLTGEIQNLLHPQMQASGKASRGRPSADLVSGMISDNGMNIIFDYNTGARSLAGGEFPDMPSVITTNSPMPLWNVAQEIHTGRIYQLFGGLFYLLIVPLVGLFTILVFITGFIRWRKIYRKK
jgi:hypothetical protein